MPSEYAKNLLTCIKSREVEIMSNSVILAGWFLDKTVGLMLKDEEQIEQAKSVIRMIYKKRNSLLEVVDEQEEEDSEQEIQIVDNTQSDNLLDNYLRTLGSSSVKKIPQKIPKLSALELEIKKYEEMPAPAQRSNTFDWWLENSKIFPILSPIALDIVSAPVTEVTVERLFSHLKIILTKHRSMLKEDLLEDVLFLRLNRFRASKQNE